MLNAGEIGATFTIVDRVTEVLNRIAAGFDRIQLAIKETQTGLDRLHMPAGFMGEVSKLDRAMKGLVDATGKVDGSFDTMAANATGATSRVVAGFGEVDAAINTSIARVEALQARMDSLKMPALEAATVGGGGGGLGRPGRPYDDGGSRRPGSGGGIGRAGHGSDLHLGGRVRVGEAEGPHIGIGGTAGAIAATLLYGVVEESKIDDIVTRALLTGQQPVGPNVSSEGIGKRLHDIIQQQAAVTGFSYHDVGEAILKSERQLGSLPTDKRLDMLEAILPYAGAEAKLKDSSLPESMEAFISLAHQSGVYDQAGVKELARSFAYTSLLTPATPQQFVNTLSYSLPTLHAGLDMDPESIMLLTAAAQTAGIRSTKSGTWIRSFFQQAEPSVSVDGAKLSKTQIKHNAALRHLGMLDDSDQPTWQVKGADGKIDWQNSLVKVADVLQAHLKDMPIDQRLQELKTGFGERGGGIAAMMNNAQFVAQLPVLEARMKSFQADNVLEKYSTGSPIQQARQALADFNNAMSDLGATVMPAATAAVRAFEAIVKPPKVSPAEEKQPWWQRFLTEGVRSIFGNDVQPVADALLKVDPKADSSNLPRDAQRRPGPGQRPLTHQQIAWQLQHPGATPPDDAGPFHQPAFPHTPTPGTSGAQRVTMTDPIKIAGPTKVEGKVDAAVTGAVAITNISALASVIAAAVAGAVGGIGASLEHLTAPGVADTHSGYVNPVGTAR